jgi:hypothetical protein
MGMRTLSRWTLVLALLTALPACNRNVCPSVGGSEASELKKAKPPKKPQTGLWGKKGPR